MPGLPEIMLGAAIALAGVTLYQILGLTLRYRRAEEVAAALAESEAALAAERNQRAWAEARIEALERVVRADHIRLDVLRNDATLWHWWTMDLLRRYEPQTLQQLTQKLGDTARAAIARGSASESAPKVH